jgi:putative hydrolase of the HAD superfamily
MPEAKRKIQAVIFDLDDTLYLERDYVRSGFRGVERHLHKTLDRTDRFSAWLWRRFLAGLRDRSLDAMNEEFSLGLSADGIAELVKCYREHAPDIEPDAGMVELLGRLHAACRIGLLSDGTLPGQSLKFDALGVARFFDAVLFTESLGRDAWKPSTKGFEWIQEKLGVAHEACAYIADNPAKDFVAPNKLGWRTIQILRPGQVHSSNPAAPGGEPQHIARGVGDIWVALL